jgi:hypothetical protein
LAFSIPEFNFHFLKTLYIFIGFLFHILHYFISCSSLNFLIIHLHICVLLNFIDHSYVHLKNALTFHLLYYH